MEFDFNINILLKDIITKVDGRLQICRNAEKRFADSRLLLFDIIDKMGEASAKAQCLTGAITTGRKLQASDHHLYIMKDASGNRGHGAVIGILKIGRKRLFVYDYQGQQWEMNPQCVLDFYVHESRQRMGCGRRLFDFMLKNENILPQHLAIDRPSDKFSSFLAKHYGLKDEIPQVNNFVIFDGFFRKRPDGDFLNNRRNVNPPKPADFPNKSPERWGDDMAASVRNVLPRHWNSQQEVLKELKLNPRSAHNLNNAKNTTSSPGRLNDKELCSTSADNNRSVGLHLLSNVYSHNQALPPVQSSPPLALYAAAQNDGRTADSLPDGSKSVNRSPSSNSTLQSAAGTSPSKAPGSNTLAVNEKEKSPALLPKENPPRDYTEFLNMHQNYQDRSGHLIVPADPRYGHIPSAAATTNVVSLPPVTEMGRQAPNSVRSAVSYGGGYYTNPALHSNSDTSWTVFGVLRKQQQQMKGSSYGRSRLW